jgi:hypothetical protein
MDFKSKVEWTLRSMLCAKGSPPCPTSPSTKLVRVPTVLVVFRSSLEVYSARTDTLRAELKALTAVVHTQDQVSRCTLLEIGRYVADWFFKSAEACCADLEQ